MGSLVAALADYIELLDIRPEEAYS
jgi:hypothetical protein